MRLRGAQMCGQGSLLAAQLSHAVSSEGAPAWEGLGQALVAHLLLSIADPKVTISLRAYLMLTTCATQKLSIELLLPLSRSISNLAVCPMRRRLAVRTFLCGWVVWMLQPPRTVPLTAACQVHGLCFGWMVHGHQLGAPPSVRGHHSAFQGMKTQKFCGWLPVCSGSCAFW